MPISASPTSTPTTPTLRDRLTRRILLASTTANVERGLIENKDSTNGQRRQDDESDRASSISLTPIAARYRVFCRLAAEAQARDQHVGKPHRAAMSVRRPSLSLGDAAAARQVAGDNARTLRAVASDAEGIATPESAAGIETARQRQPSTAAAVVRRPAPGPLPDTSGLPASWLVSPEEIIRLAPALQRHLPAGCWSWPDVCTSASRFADAVGIPAQLWAEACRVLGRTEAAIAMAILSTRPVDAVRTSATAAFHAMIRQARSGDLNLADTIWRLRAGERARERAEERAEEGTRP